MQICDFLNTLYKRFSCNNQSQFILEQFSALCGETDPVTTNDPDNYKFSDCLPSGLSSGDKTSKKRLFGGSGYKGLTKPIKKHIQGNANKATYITYCEAKVTVEQFKGLCGDFNVSSDSGKALVFEAIFENYLQFANSAGDNASGTFIADYVTEHLMNTPEEQIESENADTPPAPLCAEDDICIVRQNPTYPHDVTFYNKFVHHWVIKNSGLAVWNGRYMDFVNSWC